MGVIEGVCPRVGIIEGMYAQGFGIIEGVYPGVGIIEGVYSPEWEL